MKRSYLFLVFTIAFLNNYAQVKKGNLVIKNGTVITITNGIKDSTDILVTNGKIVKLGKNIQPPENYKVINATGLFVMPGIIDAHSHIAIEAVNEMTNPITSEVCMADALNPMDISIYRALAGGVTSAQILHGSANAIGGECETIKLRYGTFDPRELIFGGAPRSIKFALGENPTRIHGNNHNIVPRTRMGVEFIIRQALTEARQYMEDWNVYNSNKAKKSFHGAPPLYSKRLETLADVLRGNVIIQCHSYRSDEIYMLLKVCSDFGIRKIIFQHVNEGFKVAPELAAYGAMASVFADWWAYKFEVYYSTAYNAAILTRNGVITSINSDSHDDIRHLYHEAAKTMKYGNLTTNEALSLITINPAIQLGIDKQVGSIEIGKDADIAIFKGHPLSIYTIPMITVVDGIVRFDRENDKADMRLYIDLEEPLDNVVLNENIYEDECMRGVLKCNEFK